MLGVEDLDVLDPWDAPADLLHVAQEGPHLFHRCVHVERNGPLGHRSHWMTERRKIGSRYGSGQIQRTRSWSKGTRARKKERAEGLPRDASAYGVARGGLSPFARTEGRCAYSRRSFGSWAFRPSVCRFSVSAY